MDNSMEKRGFNGNANFNNMTDEQLQQWHTAFLTEAQRENYVNHNLEIVRHYRTEAIARAPAFDIERNAISAAIARHGLWMPPPPNSVSQSESSPQCTMTSTAAVSSQEEGQPPPQRRPRIEQPHTQQQQQQQLPCVVAASRGSVSGASASNYGHYVALAHIFSDTYATRAEPVNGIINNVNANTNANTNANRNNSNNNNADDDREDSNINEVALTETIDSLGLRRT